ncbi:MAG: putative sugar nucleotidyl transferase [Candidatus Kapaibacteriota bacterium]
MIANIILVDIDNDVNENSENNLDYYPFCVLHTLFELRTGAYKSYERIGKLFSGAELFYKSSELKLKSFLKRNEITTNSKDTYNDCLVLNSKFLINNQSSNQIKEFIKSNPFDNIKFTNNNEIVGYFFNAVLDKQLHNIDWITNNSTLYEMFKFQDIEIENVSKINYIWDSLDFVGEMINEDKDLFNMSSPKSIGEGNFVVNSNNLLVGKNVTIEPMVVLNAENGAIIIDNNAKIMSNTVIYGPCYIGKNSTIKPGAKIYPNTSIGEWCKVGGEVENSIFQAYSNKQHEGFLGHSFISEWVNLGADTNNSDLKNTYSNISMQLPHKLVNTNRIFLGLICGDHTKSGINSMFTTGTVSGLCGILVKEWFLPNYIKSYTWGGKTNSPIYKFEKAIETAKIVMLRRNKELCEEEIELLKLEYERVSQE